MNNPEDFDNKKELIEAIESLSSEDLSYGIALSMNHRYDFGGYSVGRSERSFLLDMYFRLNYDKNSEVSQFDPFTNIDIFVDIAKSKLISNFKGNRVNIDVHDPKDLSCLILYLWIKHYREKVKEINEGDSFRNDVDYSFNSEIKKAEIVYGLYIQSNDIDESVLDIESQKFINNDISDMHKYKTEFRWLVDDISNELNQGKN